MNAEDEVRVPRFSGWRVWNERGHALVADVLLRELAH